MVMNDDLMTDNPYTKSSAAYLVLGKDAMTRVHCCICFNIVTGFFVFAILNICSAIVVFFNLAYYTQSASDISNSHNVKMFYIFSSITMAIIFIFSIMNTRLVFLQRSSVDSKESRMYYLKVTKYCLFCVLLTTGTNMVARIFRDHAMYGDVTISTIANAIVTFIVGVFISMWWRSDTLNFIYEYEINNL